MAGNPEPILTASGIRRRWHFAMVLLASLLLAIAQPLTAGLLGEQGSFDVFFSLLIVSVLLLVFEEREHRRLAFSLGIAAFICVWIGYSQDGTVARLFLVGAYLLAVGFFSLALYGIVRSIFSRRVTGDAIFGAVCGYLLLGIIWSLLYSAVETGFPGSFSVPPSRVAAAATMRPDRAMLSYYSFITLSTVGYGDVVPTTPLARTIAWIEPIAGQFYLAVLVAGLVGFIVTQTLTDRTDKGGPP